jgi:hypothetical protein
MKILYKISLFAMLIFSAHSCGELSDININPNASSVAADAQLLTAAQGYLSYIVDTDLNAGSFLWSQHYTWGIGVSIGNAERFVAEPDDENGYWARAYSNALTDLQFVAESDNPNFAGIAKTLQAYIFQGLVDHFGNVPYSDALSGEAGVFAPAYDDAASIYSDLVNKLDEAIADLSIIGASIGAEDLVFGGDISKWLKFANSLKLRVLMRQSEVSDPGQAVRDLISSGTFIASADDRAEIDFLGTSGDENPMYARFEWGVGDFYFASNATLGVLRGLNDPREFAFYTPASTGAMAGQIRGIDQGTIDNEPFTAPDTDYSGSSAIAYGAANSVVLMSEWEVWFLRAEAAARYGTSDNDVTAFSNAVTANFDYWQVEGGADYVASLGYENVATLDGKLDEIAVQKWISMNGTQEDEGWTELRRFDRPASRLFTGAGGILQSPPLSVLGPGIFPSIWLIPESERSLNASAPAQQSITDKVFWDN